MASSILTVWGWLKCLIVSSWNGFKTQIFQAKGVFFFSSHGKTEQREVGTKVIINILCTLLAYKDLKVELNCWMPQAVRVNRVAIFGKLQMFKSFKSDVWKHSGFAVSRNENGEKVIDPQETICRHGQTRSRTHLQPCFCTQCNRTVSYRVLVHEGLQYCAIFISLHPYYVHIYLYKIKTSSVQPRLTHHHPHRCHHCLNIAGSYVMPTLTFLLLW